MAQLKEITTPATYSTQEELEKLLLEGLNSGEPVRVTPQFWEDFRVAATNRLSENRKAS